MTPRLARTVLTAATLVGVLGVTACSGGGSTTRSTNTSAITTTTSTVPPTTTTTLPPLVGVGTLAVGVRNDTYVDPSRPSPANGGAPGAPNRSMLSTVWYPATGSPSGAAAPGAHGPYPLVVFAHGFAVTPRTYAALLTQWASAGYVVVAPAIPWLNGDAPGGASHTDYGAANIADLDFVLADALRRAATPGDPPGAPRLHQGRTAGRPASERPANRTRCKGPLEPTGILRFSLCRPSLRRSSRSTATKSGSESPCPPTSSNGPSTPPSASSPAR